MRWVAWSCLLGQDRLGHSECGSQSKCCIPYIVYDRYGGHWGVKATNIENKLIST